MGSTLQKQDVDNQAERLRTASLRLFGLLTVPRTEEELLHKGVESLTALIGARYGAIGILDEAGKLKQFVHTGIAPDEAARIGHLPEGRGLLGAVIHENHVLRLEDMARDPRPAGFPPNHPPMKSLLAEPVSHAGTVYGRVYLSEKSDAAPFTAEDEQLVTRFAEALALTLRFHRTEGAHRQLSSAIEQTDDSVVITDRDGIIEYVNPAFETVTGYSRQEALGEKPSLVKSGLHDVAFCERVWETILRGEAFRDIFINRKKSGALYFEEKTITPLKNGHGDITHFVSTGKDITARVMAEEENRHIQRFLDSVVDNLPHMLFVKDAKDLRFVRINKAGEELVGYTRDELVGKTDYDFFPKEEADFFTARDREVLASGRLLDIPEEPIHTRAKGVRILRTKKLPILDASNQPLYLLGISEDITERKQAEERLSYLAYYDVLTGLPNRVLLLERLRQAMVDAERVNRLVVVMFLDLDRFKVINDTLGHHVGDALLKGVAGRLQACVRPGDTISRLGGDEFTVVLANVANIDDVTRVVHKLNDSLALPFYAEGRELFTTTSIGVTIFPLDVHDAEGLLKNADAAMYHAKDQGRNNFKFFTSELNVRAERRLKLETALRQALARQEISVHYQPQVDLKSGRITGMEALARWQHPELGQVPPIEFIPVAEETGLILPIGDWVLREACRQVRTWHETGFAKLQVAVNISGKQLLQKDFPQQAQTILHETGLAARYLDLELTESILMVDTGGAAAAMQALHALGVSFSMDDFGTGYSSLAYLKRFPIDILKIDRSFVCDLATDPNDVAIVKTIIAMARALDMRVIAEGVETYEQLSFLRAQGCDGSQGYYCSKPLTADDFTELLADWERLSLGKCRLETPARRLVRSDTSRSPIRGKRKK